MKRNIKLGLIPLAIILILGLSIYFYIISRSIECEGDGWDRKDWSCKSIDSNGGVTSKGLFYYLPLVFKCKIQGGRVFQRYYLIPYFSCEFPSEDAGKDCYSDLDCEYYCIVEISNVKKSCEISDGEIYLCPRDFQGKCSGGFENEEDEDVYILNDQKVWMYEKYIIYD